MLGRKLTVVTGCCRPKAVIRKLRLVGSNGGTKQPHRFQRQSAPSQNSYSSFNNSIYSTNQLRAIDIN